LLYFFKYQRQSLSEIFENDYDHIVFDFVIGRQAILKNMATIGENAKI